MILDVVKYGHPVLRKKGEPIGSITPKIEKLIADMLETMHAAKGIGLAAQQIGQALQLTVIDVRGVEDRPSSLQIEGQPVEVGSFMPLALINPVVKPVGKSVPGMEGCLSFPEIFAEIARPETVDVEAMNEKGERIEFHCGGLLARVVQHETDHLHGILFIDRMTRETKAELKSQLEDLRAATKAVSKT
jgi:peptide deformylase